MRTMVVGATGYLGGAVSHALADAGHDVVELSRSGGARRGVGVTGDVQSVGLGLSDEALGQVREIEAIVACFGSVDMGSDPASVVNVHVNGTQNVLDFAASVSSVDRVVYVSSVLALGRASGRITNRDLSRGQTFRNWYEFAKYRGELIARRETRVPVSILRLGTLLGAAPAAAIPQRGGPLSVLPHLLRGYPVLLERAGTYPIYAADVSIAAGVISDLLTSTEPAAACTYFDPDLPSLAAVLERLCRPWNVVPKIIDNAAPSLLLRMLARRLGIEVEVSEYARPLFEFDSSIFDSLPGTEITSRTDYIVDTGRALRDSGMLLMSTGGGQ